jgi:hypothetical protein
MTVALAVNSTSFTPLALPLVIAKLIASCKHSALCIIWSESDMLRICWWATRSVNRTSFAPLALPLVINKNQIASFRMQPNSGRYSEVVVLHSESCELLYNAALHLQFPAATLKLE